MHIEELPYPEDAAQLFSAFAASPWAAFLDSGRPHHSYGRFDILVADPHTTLLTRGGDTEIQDADGLRHSNADPLDLLREALAGSQPSIAGLPFNGGAVGYFGYDLARRLHRLPVTALDAEHLPEMAVGVYATAVVVDHLQRRCVLVDHSDQAPSSEHGQRLRQRLATASARVQAAPLTLASAWQVNLDHAAYQSGYERIQHYIREGDCYQVNYARRFAAPASGDAWSTYRALRRVNPAPFGAFLRFPFTEILSFSPERFLQLRSGRVETRPIKGTRPRGTTTRRDHELADALRTSDKDRAENLMIVDLLRNDLGKNCVPGSIHVPELFRVESFPTVHHLVSTVSGELAADRDALDLLRGCFPGGSITGAPKLRAMQIIEELEPHRRGVYCGAIGYIGCDGAMDSNIAIRTLVYSSGQVRFWSGGGIVADSEAAAEFAETEDKAAAFLRFFGGNRPPRRTELG